MPESFAPKHRSAPRKRVRTGAKKGAKNAVLFSGAAMFATALSISAGVAGEPKSADDTLVNLTAGKSRLTEADLSAREQSASRSSNRTSTTSVLKAAELGSAKGVSVTRSETLSLGELSGGDPRAIARRLLSQYGMSAADYDCIDRLWSSESGWNVHANNPHSAAYGIPQALPGSKMASAGPNWQDNAETQIRWGLNYIAQRYGSGCSAWSYKQSHGWY